MNQIMKHDEAYKKWITELSEKYRRSQIKAAISVNEEMIKFYWSLGKDIHEMHFESNHGSDFFSTLSRDLKKKYRMQNVFQRQICGIWNDSINYFQICPNLGQISCVYYGDILSL